MTKQRKYSSIKIQILTKTHRTMKDRSTGDTVVQPGKSEDDAEWLHRVDVFAHGSPLLSRIATQGATDPVTGYTWADYPQHFFHRFVRSFGDLYRDNPELADTIMELGIDGLHGTTSWNLQSILEHGIVSSSLLAAMGIVAIGKENYSQPDLRKGVHVVPITEPEQTTIFAERRLEDSPTNWYVRPDALEDIILDEELINAYRGKVPTIYHAYRGARRERLDIERLISEGRLDPSRPSYPVVLGIASGKLDSDFEVALHRRSSVRGDTSIRGIVPRSAVATFFVPVEHMGDVSELIASKYPDGTALVLPLDELRSAGRQALVSC